MFILNDLHIGATRKAGATPTSAVALKQYLQSEFSRLVNQCSGHLCILGDLFDSFSVDVGEVVKVYETLCDYINDGNTLTMVCGNHDHSVRPGTSSFHLLAHILKSRFPDEVSVIDYTNGLTEVEDGIWAISHMPNQSLFDLEVEKACANNDVKMLLLHCNIENTFTEHSDHSLNLAGDLLDKVLHAGIRVICAHEHTGRILHGGRVHVIGNQLASSVSDCVNEMNDNKVYVEIVTTDARVSVDKHGVKTACDVQMRSPGNRLNVIEHPSCTLSTLYAKLDWATLEDVDANLKFIRVGGFATAAEAPAALAAIAKLRQNHGAFVITNAVQIEGMGTEMEVASLESVKSFNVLEALLEILSPEESKVVKELLEC